ncbi:Electron transfer flavoprotein domain [Sporomusa acidovorans]|nr:hypothetical protein SPACI_22030 [Sporomusa acidovorans DSM 3132]SDF79821.1 Electron transfer flavoprotein domain [Sporomusa acidovorans]
MKIIVVFKWSKNPQDARVGVDGSVDWRGVKMAVSDDDPAAMEIAAAIAAGGEIIGLMVGDGDVAWAAARSAARTVVVTDALTDVDSSVTGAVLAAAIRRVEGVDAVLIGDSAWDYGVVTALTGQLAGRPWPVLYRPRWSRDVCGWRARWAVYRRCLKLGGLWCLRFRQAGTSKMHRA